jgi:hypothetical protein
MYKDKKEWLKENAYKARLVSTRILPYRPDVGTYVSVFNIDIPQYLFPEEYAEIMKQYYKVLDKMSKEDEK